MAAPPPSYLRDRIKHDEDRYVRFNAAVALGRRGDLAAAATLREMLSPADLAKVVDMPSDTEKQNKIEAIELEAMGALRTSISNGSPELARSLTQPITELVQIGPGQRSKPGARAFAKFTNQALIYRPPSGHSCCGPSLSREPKRPTHCLHGQAAESASRDVPCRRLDGPTERARGLLYHFVGRSVTVNSSLSAQDELEHQ